MVGCRIRDVGFSKAGEQRSDLNLFTFVPFLQDASCAPLWTRRRYWFRPHSRTTYTPLLQRLCSQSTSPSHPRAPRHPLPAEIRCYEIHRFVLSASYRDLTAMSAHSQHRKSSVRRFGYMNYREKRITRIDPSFPIYEDQRLHSRSKVIERFFCIKRVNSFKPLS